MHLVHQCELKLDGDRVVLVCAFHLPCASSACCWPCSCSWVLGSRSLPVLLSSHILSFDRRLTRRCLRGPRCRSSRRTSIFTFVCSFVLVDFANELSTWTRAPSFSCLFGHLLQIPLVVFATFLLSSSFLVVIRHCHHPDPYVVCHHAPEASSSSDRHISSNSSSSSNRTNTSSATTENICRSRLYPLVLVRFRGVCEVCVLLCVKCEWHCSDLKTRVMSRADSSFHSENDRVTLHDGSRWIPQQRNTVGHTDGVNWTKGCKMEFTVWWRP